MLARPVHSPAALPNDTEGGHVDDQGSSSLALPIVEERATIALREVETAHVRIRTIVDEEQRTLNAELARGDVAVERRQVERQVAEAPAPYTDDDGALIVPIVEERLSVEKRLFVVEELVVRTISRLEQVSVPTSVRTMRAIVEREDTVPPEKG